MEFGFKKQLVKVRIRNFEPLTANNNPMERKAILKDRIKEQINLAKARKDCEGKLFSLKITYYLNDNTDIEGKYKKDLDNMTKIVSDTLADYLSQQDKDRNEKTGLGLIRDDKDIHEMYTGKKFVNNESDQGLDIALYKWDDKHRATKHGF